MFIAGDRQRTLGQTDRRRPTLTAAAWLTAADQTYLTLILCNYDKLLKESAAVSFIFITQQVSRLITVLSRCLEHSAISCD